MNSITVYTVPVMSFKEDIQLGVLPVTAVLENGFDSGDSLNMFLLRQSLHYVNRPRALIK